jgi:hypothetical protein
MIHRPKKTSGSAITNADASVNVKFIRKLRRTHTQSPRANASAYAGQ